ncbi:5778_t:CDS:2, partial [Diversispora eburnea]
VDNSLTLWLTLYNSKPHPRFSTNIGKSSGIDTIGKRFVLNKWYHIEYTLLDLHKRLDFYIDGKWFGFKSIEQVQKEYIVFNKDSLRIGLIFCDTEFKGQMSNFCYYNWHLSADEIAKDFIATYETYQ